MDWTLAKLAEVLQLTLQGEDRIIRGVNTLDAAGPDELSFLANPSYIPKLATTKAGGVVLHPNHADAAPSSALLSSQPYVDFAKIITLFAKPQGEFFGISELAYIHPDAHLGSGCTVYPFAYVGPRARLGDDVCLFPSCYIGEDAIVGAGSVLYPHVVLMAGTVIGARATIHAGAVLGADGFGFARQKDGEIFKIPQIGTTLLGDDVEVGANTCIDRAVLGLTSVGNGTKIDNLVQLGHNVTVGEKAFIVSQVGVSGSTQIGNHTTIAGQAGIAGHLKIGNNTIVGPRAGVAKDIADNKIMGGTPAVEQGVFMRTLATMPKLPEMYRRLGKLEKELASLRALLPSTTEE